MTDTMKLSKETQALLRKVVEAQVEECECGGSSVEPDLNAPCSPASGLKFKDCPTCADLRALLEELCWHEMETPDFNDPDVFKWQCSCGASNRTHDVNSFWIEHANPDLTTAMSGHELLIVSWMRRAGLWGGFVAWHNEEVETPCLAGTETDCECWSVSAETLINGLSLTQAIKRFLEERV